MKQIEVEIEGTNAILMHSAQIMLEEQQPKKNPAKQYDHKEYAEKVAYRNKKKELYIPSRCLKACIVNASSWLKFGKKSAKPIIAGSSRIEPEEITLLNKKNEPIKNYEIDLRPVVIQNNRIVRARPKINEWKAKFKIIYNEKIIAEPKVFLNILEEAGTRVGLLDNRPQRYGEYGTFKINKFLPR